jgi:hypothetical protein
MLKLVLQKQAGQAELERYGQVKLRGWGGTLKTMYQQMLGTSSNQSAPGNGKALVLKTTSAILNH